MPNPAGLDPAVYRRRLRSELRRAREAASRTQRETALAMDWSLSKLIRIETGDVRVGTNDLRALLSYYEIPAERINDLVETARASREPGRWGAYRAAASPELLTYCGYEAAAAIVRNFEPTFIPGLLQTEEYARETLSKRIDDPERVDGLVDLRIERQEILVREPAPRFHFIIDESAIRHVMGGKHVMRRQLIHLKEMSNQSHITLRIVPFTAGWYNSRMLIPYVLLEFDDPEDGEILYIESPTGEFIVRESNLPDGDKDGPTDFLQDFWSLEQIAAAQDADALLAEAITWVQGLPD